VDKTNGAMQDVLIQNRTVSDQSEVEIEQYLHNGGCNITVYFFYQTLLKPNTVQFYISILKE
tara:strand:+ start:2737 stop:2922 length:186 start_codon:yes stop_codon:yes gene_type:complete